MDDHRINSMLQKMFCHLTHKCSADAATLMYRMDRDNLQFGGEPGLPRQPAQGKANNFPLVFCHQQALALRQGTRLESLTPIRGALLRRDPIQALLRHQPVNAATIASTITRAS